MKLTENQHKVEDETNQPNYTDFHKLGEKDNDGCRKNLEKDTMQTNDEENTNDSVDCKMIFAEKCHLSYFDKESKTWITIGLGIAKILECKDALQFRVIMTSKKVNTICADHLITCHMKLLPKDSKQRSFTYWSKIKQTDLKEECLQVKFANKNKASQFAEIFNECCRKLNEDDKVSIDMFTVDSEDIHQVGRRFVCQARLYSDRYLNTNQEVNPMYSTKTWVAQTCFVGSHSYAANKSCFRVACTDTTLTDTTMEGACNVVETDKESKELSIGDMVTFSCIDTTYTIDLTDSEDSFKTSYHSCLTPEKVTNPLETYPSYYGSSLEKPYPTTNYYVNHKVLNTETIFPNYSCSAEPLLHGLDFINASRPETVNRNQDHYSNTDDTTTDTSLSAPAIPPTVFNTNFFLRPLKCPLFYNSFNEQQEQDNFHFVFPTREQDLSNTKPGSEDVSSSKTKTHQNKTSVFGNQEKNSKDNLIMDTQPQDELNYSLNKKENIDDLVGAGKSELDSDKTDLPRVIDETENKCENTAPKGRIIKKARSNIFKRRQNQTNQIPEIITESHVNEHRDVGITEITDNTTKGLRDDQNTVDDMKVQFNTESTKRKENQSTEPVVLNIGKGDPPEDTCNDEKGDPVHTGCTCRNCEGGDLNVESDEGNGDINYGGQKGNDGNMNSEFYHQIVDESSTGDQKGKDGDPNVESKDHNSDTDDTGQNREDLETKVISNNQNGDTSYTCQKRQGGDPNVVSDDQNGDTTSICQNSQGGDPNVESDNQNGGTSHTGQNLEDVDLNDESNDVNGDTHYTSQENVVGDQNVKSNTHMGDTHVTSQKGKEGDTNAELKDHYSGQNRDYLDPKVISNNQNGDISNTCQFHEDGDPNVESDDQNGATTSIGQNLKEGDVNVESGTHICDISYPGLNLEDADPIDESNDQNGDKNYPSREKEVGDRKDESNTQNGDTSSTALDIDVRERQFDSIIQMGEQNFSGQKVEDGDLNEKTIDQNGDTNYAGQNVDDGDTNSESYHQIVDASRTGDQKGKDGDPNVESKDHNGDKSYTCQFPDQNFVSDGQIGDTSSIGPKLKEGDFTVDSDEQNGDTSRTGQCREEIDDSNEYKDQNGDTHYAGQDKDVGDRIVESNTQMGDTNIAGQKGNDGDTNSESHQQNGDTSYTGKKGDDCDTNSEYHHQNGDTSYTGNKGDECDKSVESNHHIGDTSYTSKKSGDGDPSADSNVQNSATNYTFRNREDGDPNGHIISICPNRDSGDFNVTSACQNGDTHYTGQDNEVDDRNVESNSQMGDTNITGQKGDDGDTNSESHYQNGDTSYIGQKVKEGDTSVESNVQNIDTNYIGINKENGDPNNESKIQNVDTRSTGHTGQDDDTNVETKGQNGDTKFTSQNRGNGDPNVESNDQDGDTNHAGQNSNDIGANADTVNLNVDTNYTCQNRGDLESNDQNGFIRYTVENSEDCGHNVESDDQNPDTINISKKRKDEDPNYNSDNQNCETLHSDENKELGGPYDHTNDATVTDHNMRKTYDNNTTNDKNDKPAHRYINIEPNSSHESTENELRDLSSVDNTYTTNTTTPKFRRNSSKSSSSTSQLLQSNVKSERKFSKPTPKHRKKKIQDRRNTKTEVEAEKDLCGLYNRDSKEGLISSVGGKNNEHLDRNGQGVKQVVTEELVDTDSKLMLQGVGTEQVGTEHVDSDNAVNFNAVDKQGVGTEQVDSDNAVNFNAVDKQGVGTEQVDSDNAVNDKRKSPNDENETTNSIDEKKMETLVILEGQTKIDNKQVEVDDDDLDEDCTINALHVPERKYSANDDSNHTRDDDTLEDERGASPIEIIVQLDDKTDERKEIQDVENFSQCYARKVNKKCDERDDKPCSNTTLSRNNNSSLKYVGLLLILIFSFFIVFQFLL